MGGTFESDTGGTFDPLQSDNLYYGKIEHIDALVNYEGADLNELEHAFRETVEDYLAYSKG